MRSRRYAFLAMLLCVSAASAPQSASAAPAIYNLGTIRDYSIGWDVNNSGQVLGRSDTDGFGGIGFFYTGTPGIDGVMHEISVEPFQIPFRFNDAGQFTGDAPFDTPEDGFRIHATLGAGLPDSVVIFDLGTLRGAGGLSAGNGINNSGQVAGQSQTPGNGGTHAFLYTGVPGSGGVMHDLGTLGGRQSIGYAVNDFGSVTGSSSTVGDAATHAFRYTGTPGSDGVMHDLGTGAGYDINNSGQVVGSSFTAVGGPHAFLYTGTPGSDGVMHDLGTLGGTFSAARQINASGQVVGTSNLAGNPSMRAFLYTGTPGVDGRMIDLDAWLDANNPAEGAKWTLISAEALNDNGLITGRGTYDDGPGGLSDGTRAFLLDASALIPEPGSFSLLAFAVSALICRHLSRPRLIAQSHR